MIDNIGRVHLHLASQLGPWWWLGATAFCLSPTLIPLVLSRWHRHESGQLRATNESVWGDLEGLLRAEASASTRLAATRLIDTFLANRFAEDARALGAVAGASRRDDWLTRVDRVRPSDPDVETDQERTMWADIADFLTDDEDPASSPGALPRPRTSTEGAR